MAGSPILSLVLAGLLFHPAGDADPARLVVQLGAASYGDRVAAGEALVQLGRQALPALVRARESRDFEVRLRAEAVITRIEAAEVFNATPVQLDLADRSLAEAADAIAQASGMRLRSGEQGGNPRAQAAWPARRLSLHAAEPTPFWTVLDQFCQAAGVQREYPPAGANVFPAKPPFDLSLVPGQAHPPASDHGSLRVELLRVRYRRDRDYGAANNDFRPFGGDRAQPRDPVTGVSDASSFGAELLVSAEPRLRIFGVGAVEEVEATDDRGRSLLRPPSIQEREMLAMKPQNDPQLHPGLRYGGGSHQSMKSWPVSIPLAYPTPAARRLVTLRGVFPVVVVARRPDPLVVALQDSVGKEFAAGPTRIVIHEIKAKPGQEPTVEFTLETTPLGDGNTIAVSDAKGTQLPVNPPLDLMELRLEVIDSHGASLFWQYTRPPTEKGQGRMVIVIHDRNSQRERPETWQLRYWGMTAAATDLPFEFRDVPTP